MKIISVLLLTILTGCGNWTEQWKIPTYDPKVEIYTDPDSLCDYLIFKHTGMVPRLNRQGKLVCHSQMVKRP